MQISMIADSVERVRDVTAEAIDALKERLWREVWKDEIDLEGVEVEVTPEEGVGFVVTVKI